MNPPAKPKATEERLDELRRTATEAANLSSPAPAPAETPNTAGQDSYYNLPALKAPVWTWEVPLYFFIGGIAGVSACIAFAAQLFHAAFPLIRLSLWMALIGGAICPILLIADLGKPSRFLNMLRVFKIQSPMSVGVWVLVAFSNCALLSVVCIELIARGHANSAITALLSSGQAAGALTGLLLAGYTGVLIGATAIPVWFENRTLLPAHFLASGLGASSGILELAGFLIPATQTLGYVASSVETLVGIVLELRKHRAEAPLHQGGSGWLLRISGFAAGPGALLLRFFAGATPAGRYAAAACFLVGALLSRFGWVWAGRVSARDPQALFQTQTPKQTSHQ